MRASCRGKTPPNPPLYAGWPQIAAIGWDPVRAADSGHWLGVSKLFGGGSSINGGKLWRAEASVFEPLGFGADEVGAAFETIQAEFSEPAPRTEYASVFADAWQRLGYPAVPGAGAASWAQPDVGVHTARTMFVGGTRRTAAHPLQERPNANLTVLLHARVERVLFKARRAYAVEARVESVGRMTLRVRRGGEVLLACGAIETPKLLMLSGVGPADTLRRFDIPLVAASEGVGVRACTRVETTGPVHFHRCPVATHCHRWMRQANLIDRKEISVGVPMLVPELQGDTSTILDVATILDKVWVSVHPTHIMSWASVPELGHRGASGRSG